MVNRELLKDKYFLDNEGQEWIVEGVSGTGEYYWYCRNIDTDQKERFETNYLLQRVSSYDKDVEYFKNKNITESEMLNLIKRISEQILRKEILKEEDWSSKELDLLNKLRKGKFNIECK